MPRNVLTTSSEDHWDSGGVVSRHVNGGVGDRKKSKAIVCSSFSADLEIGFSRNPGNNISCVLQMGLGCSVPKRPHTGK